VKESFGALFLFARKGVKSEWLGRNAGGKGAWGKILTHKIVFRTHPRVARWEVNIRKKEGEYRVALLGNMEWLPGERSDLKVNEGDEIKKTHGESLRFDSEPKLFSPLTREKKKVVARGGEKR